MAQPTIVVLGGGAAGFFGAIRASELAPHARVILLEATGAPLQKVRISGGGRCNVTNAQTDPALLVKSYPRGAKELRGLFSRFGPAQTRAWFEARGVALKVEGDGRVFPVSDDSQTIIDCLLRAAKEAGVEVRTHATITTVRRVDPEAERAEEAEKVPSASSARSASESPGLELTLKDGSNIDASALLLATGSNPNGLALARKLGHTLVPGVPSLFTFNIVDPRLDGLAGVAVEKVRAKAKLPDGAVIEQEGPMLVTHWGVSAHSVLRLSAWGARDFHASGYKGALIVDWLPDVKDAALRARLEQMRASQPRGTVGAHNAAPEVPRRLWERLVTAAGGDPQMRWADVPNRGIEKLVAELKRSTFEIQGKGPFREEFVTAGGVERKEVDWRTMESRVCPGLFFAGEVLDVDALTGGYNFQNAWSTGWVAGEGMAGRAGAKGEG